MSTVAPVWTIPPGVSFVDVLARGLLTQTAEIVAGGDPLALARYTILLPTRRACRALADAFLRSNHGAPLLLPRLEPIGELDEEEFVLVGDGAGDRLDLPPAISPARRLLLLARSVMAFHRARDGKEPDADQAAWLAQELARLLDQVHTEEISFARLKELAPEEFASHWRDTLEFLKILTEAWPRVLAEEKSMDPAARRNALIDARAKAWQDHPPADPVIAAGSTGSVPATARLIATVATFPNGRVVLPGLDRRMDEASWRTLEPSHPQYGLKMLLERLQVPRGDVNTWPGVSAPDDVRPRLMSEAMRPAATTDAWRDGLISPKDAATARRQLRRVDCPTPQEEAGVIALALREVLEDGAGDRTAALVTLDRDLARRVAAELRRWGVEIDDSAGRPLSDTPPGSFLLLSARMIVAGLAPVPLLAACKHPLTAGGLSPPDFRSGLRNLELALLRGPRPAPGVDGLKRALTRLDERTRRSLGDLEPLANWIDGLAHICRPFAELVAQGKSSLTDFLYAHAEFAEALAASDEETGAARLWVGEAGERAAMFVAELAAAAQGFPEISGTEYPGLLEALMAGIAVRPRFGRHARLAIWGPLEARLQHADLIVLGGLNEGSWPRDGRSDPWMSRQMRDRFGLSPQDRLVGLSAHDFVQAVCAKQVLLTRAQRVEGTPMVPSRWLRRIETVLRGPESEDEPAWESGPWLAWQRKLDEAEALAAIGAPAPRPPVKVRPRVLSVTQIETWMRDPYAIYARHILGLLPLDPVDADPGAADYGNVIHAILDRFVRANPGDLPNDAQQRLIEIGQEVFERGGAQPGTGAFWWPRFLRIADWFVETERTRRTGLARVFSEIGGRLTIRAPAGTFAVTAQADRLEIRTDGTLAVIDYKTGSVPKPNDIKLGYAPQLPLEAAIAADGGFGDITPSPVAELAFWRTTGGDPPGEEKIIKGDPVLLAETALARLKDLVARFDLPATPYLSRPVPTYAPRYSDYAHLARVREWTARPNSDEA